MNWFSGRKENAPPTDASFPPAVTGMRTDPGCHRPLNEDSVRVTHVGPTPHGDRGLLLVVADGMGGHEAGEVASQTAVEVIEQVYGQAKGTPGEALNEAFRRAHEQILDLSTHNPAMAGMGTTCTGLALVGNRAWAAHVGDSRLYLMRNGAIYQISEDQTQCMELVRRGLLTLEEAERHEDRNILAHAMGTRPELVAMSWPEPMAVAPGDRFLLCSDGLHDLVANAEILEVAGHGDPDESCARLVRMARDRGGYDNITVAMAVFPGGAETAASPKPTREYEANA